MATRGCRWGSSVSAAALGLLRVDLNARVLAVLLIIEVLVVVAYDVAAFRAPVAVTFVPLDPATLLVPGVGAVIAFDIAAFTGVESGAIYSEETRDPGRTVARVTFVAVAFTGLFYALSSWAMVAATGTGDLQAAATQNGPGLVFGPLGDHYGATVADIATVRFLTSVFAALLSFHNGVARYLFALGREQVLPAGLSTVGTRSGGPVAGRGGVGRGTAPAPPDDLLRGRALDDAGGVRCARRGPSRPRSRTCVNTTPRSRPGSTG